MEGNSIVLFENLCNIFEMRIKLDREKGVMSSMDVLSNYEKYAKKIDAIYNSEFQKDLKPFMSPGITLEKEKDRLRRLIKLLEDRLDRRIELEDRYYNTTGKYIVGLQMIVSEEELEDKKERLSLVSRYLDTSEEIDNVTESISELKRLLNEEEEKKEQYESKNSIMEDELYSSFMNVIKDNDYYKNINEEKISDELEVIKGSVLESKETLDITKDSVGNLITSGLHDDYASYIEEAERNYYNCKNKEIILNIYKVVSSFEEDFKLICGKREKISDLILEKKELSSSLSIDVSNELLSFEKVVSSQIDTLNNEREVLDNINNYTSRIKFKEDRLEELNESNNSVEILSLLREYGIIETYDTEDIVLEEESEVTSIDIPTLDEYNESNIELPSLEELIKPVDIEETVVEEVYNPYRIVDVIDYPVTLNVGLARLKGESVREKVNKKLNPKKEEKELVKEERIEEPVTDVEVSPVLETIEVEDNVPTNEVQIETVTTEEVVANDNSDKDKEVSTIEMPVWELPTMVEPKRIEEEPKPIIPEESITNSLPVWEAITPVFEETPVTEDNKAEMEDTAIELNINSDINNNNMFWIPVSSEKVENNAFPTIKTNDNNQSNSGFIFPTINN